jgi:membrane-bound metal-dependent hydrolase YbcI (DUF457 family)
MPLAATHVLLAIIILDLYRDYVERHKKYFTINTIFLGGIGGILPDIDIPINWLLTSLKTPLEIFKHGGITHTPLFGILFLLPGLYLLKKGKHKKSMCFFAISFGVFLHLLLDYLLGGGAWEGIMLFWPFSNNSYKIHLLAKLGMLEVPAAVDALILLAWIYHEESMHKIRDFF